MSAISEPNSATLRRGIRKTETVQTTLRSTIAITGVGMHTGKTSKVTLLPAPADHGIRFILAGSSFRSTVEYVTNTKRCTCLGANGGQVSTVEHLLSALSGCEVDNVEVEVDGEEIPILDGSAREWVSAITQTGLRELDRPTEIGVLTGPIALVSEDSWMVATPADELTITCVTRFEHPLLGTEVVTYRQNSRDYAQQVAPARTFGFIEEVDALRAAGLAQGGSIENALVIFPDRFTTL